MDKEVKSLCYAFVSKNIEVYIPDNNENVFIASKLFCKNCEEPWYTALQECFFCGEINYYVYICTNCKSLFSLTASNLKKDDIKKGKEKCPVCSSEGTLGQFCINENCPSNNDNVIHSKVKKFGGIFMKDSPFSLSLIHCINCGSPANFYKSFLIAVEVINENELGNKTLDKEKLLNKPVDFLIIKILREENNELNYDIKTKEELREHDNIKILKKFQKIDDLINYIFRF